MNNQFTDLSLVDRLRKSTETLATCPVAEIKNTLSNSVFLNLQPLEHQNKSPFLAIDQECVQLFNSIMEELRIIKQNDSSDMFDMYETIRKINKLYLKSEEAYNSSN